MFKSLASVRNSSRPRSLPQRWKVGRLRAATASLLVVILFAASLQSQSGADQLGKSWLRARFSLREWLGNIFAQPKSYKVDPNIVLVELDDKSLSQKGWQDMPTILLGDRLAAAIDQLNRSGARVIALDWMQPIEVDTEFHKKNDELMGQALSKTKNVVLVKFVRPDGGWVLPTPSWRYALPDAYLDDGASSMGFADLPNRDGVQYAFLPYTDGESPDKPELSFAARIAEKSGLPLPESQPVRSDGSILINYANNAGNRDEETPFYRASLYDVAQAKVPDPHFKDKIVIIGATYKGSNDFHYIPIFDTSSDYSLGNSRLISGMEIQGHAVATLLGGKGIKEPPTTWSWFLAMAAGTIGVGLYATRSWARASLTVLIFALSWMLLSFTLFWSANFSIPFVLPMFCLILGCALMGGYRAVSEERERRQVMRIWGRYQDPTLIQELLEFPDLRSGQGREAKVTVLFADLKNFTQTVEALPPAQALEALNKYLALFANVIREHGGIVDKYLGDGLMAQWGAPIAREDHATSAVNACLEIEKRVQTLTELLKKEGKVTFEARLTLHTGVVIAGPLGADEKLEYTIIGDTVNVTSRLQETAKALNCDFLISETTCAAMGCPVKTGRETTVEIRGRKAPLRVFEILGLETDTFSSPNVEPTTAKTS